MGKRIRRRQKVKVELGLGLGVEETPAPVGQQRVVIRVTPDGDWWKLTQEPPSYYICRSRRQKKVVKIGRWICQSLMEEGRPSQLVVHEQDGTIGFENTFIADPPDTLG